MADRPSQQQQQQAAIPRDTNLAERYKRIGIEALRSATTIRPPSATPPRRPIDRDTD